MNPILKDGIEIRKEENDHRLAIANLKAKKESLWRQAQIFSSELAILGERQRSLNSISNIRQFLSDMKTEYVSMLTKKEL